MKIFSELRSLVFLRRIARALEAQNDLARERMAWDYPQSVEPARRPKRSKMVSMDTADISEWNKRWEEDHPS